MSKEVKILWNRMSDKTWHDFERRIASYLDEHWTVVGFATERHMEHGDSMYVMLQRDAPESQPGAQPLGEEPPAE